MGNNITAKDVKNIYEKIEKSKKGSFFIDNSKQHDSNIIPNHVEEEVAQFFSDSNSTSQERKKALKEDASLARELIEGLV